MTEKRVFEEVFEVSRGDSLHRESKKRRSTSDNEKEDGDDGDDERSKSSVVSPILELPFELFCHIRSFLSIRDQAHLDSTCKTIYGYFTPKQREEAKQEWLLTNELQITDPFQRNMLKEREREGQSYWLVSISASFVNDEHCTPLTLEDLCNTFYELVVEELDFWFNDARLNLFESMLRYSPPKTPLEGNLSCDSCSLAAIRVIQQEKLCFRHLIEKWRQRQRLFCILTFFELCEEVALLSPSCDGGILENPMLQLLFSAKTLVWAFYTIDPRMASCYVMFQGRRRTYKTDEDEEFETNDEGEELIETEEGYEESTSEEQPQQVISDGDVTE